jgi:hypothetical protein
MGNLSCEQWAVGQTGILLRQWASDLVGAAKNAFGVE